MKNLLILIDADFIGGAETNYKYILPILEDNGWNPIFVTNGQKRLNEYFGGQNIRVKVLSSFKSYYSFSVNGRFSVGNLFRNLIAIERNKLALRKIIKAYKPVAIVSNSMISHWLLSLIRGDHSFRKVMHLHDLINRNRVMGLYGIGLDRISKRMDRIIVVSDAVKERLVPGIEAKVTRMFNPVIVNGMGRAIGNGRSLNSLRIGMFARYIPWKGHRDFLRIAAELSDPAFEFVCYGNTDNNETYYGELQNIAESLPNKERIHLHKFSHDVTGEMSKCDLIIHLSNLPEPSGRVLVEANALKIPVYAYEGGGARQLFEELKLAGILVPNGDYRAMIAEIKLFHNKTFVFPTLDEIIPERYVSKFEEVLIG